MLDDIKRKVAIGGYRLTTHGFEPGIKLEYDLYYIKNMSLLMDLKILLRTIGVVLFRQKFKSNAVKKGLNTCNNNRLVSSFL